MSPNSQFLKLAYAISKSGKVRNALKNGQKGPEEKESKEKGTISLARKGEPHADSTPVPENQVSSGQGFSLGQD